MSRSGETESAERCVGEAAVIAVMQNGRPEPYLLLRTSFGLATISRKDVEEDEIPSIIKSGIRYRTVQSLLEAVSVLGCYSIQVASDPNADVPVIGDTIFRGLLGIKTNFGFDFLNTNSKEVRVQPVKPARPTAIEVIRHTTTTAEGRS